MSDRDRPAPAGWKQAIDEAPRGAKILIVDDEASVREGLGKILQKIGYVVKAAATAEQADDWLASERFDLMLLDLDLPGMKGTEFLPWSLSRDPEMPVIMLTGIDSPDTAIECIEQGARTYLVKPVEAEFLRLAVRDAVAMRKILVERNESG